MPYRLVGGVNFYQRKEIKDILSYLKTIANGQDDLAVQRIINVPKRGIGAASIGKITAWASEQGMSFYDACARAAAVPGLGKTAGRVAVFTGQIEDFRDAYHGGASIREVIEQILADTGYKEELEAEGEIEFQTRMENIEELMNKAVSYSEDAEHPSLDEFLEQVALVADVDRMDDSENRVTLMTLHSAKGLEFPVVYLSGLEDGLFPSYMSIAADNPTEEIEEERRLCYVGITRAMKELTLTCARMRMIRGENQFNNVSRFIREIPPELLGKRSVVPPEPKHQAPPKDTPYQRAKEAFKTKTFDPKEFKVVKADSLDYTVGDTVSHIKFGQGTVLEIQDGGRDFEVKVDFEK